MPAKPANKIKFGDWLPDLPDLDNSGVLEALNVRPVGETAAGYQPYAPLATANAVFAAGSPTVNVAKLFALAGGGTSYVGASNKIYITANNGASWTEETSGIIATLVADLVQYNTLAIAAAGPSGLFQSSGSAFSAISSSPQASVLGVIGQFLVTGNILNFPHLVRWSAIANPTSFPTPGSAAAIAAQAGQQFLHLELGAVTGIFGGDQWGVILQQDAITRVTYIGGAAVFQFDTLASGVGMDSQGAAVKIGGIIYFPSSRGFYATDGVSLLPIGEEKINRWFIANVVNAGLFGPGILASVGVDWPNKIITWAFPVNGATILVHYNYETQRFTHAVDANVGFMVSNTVASTPQVALQAIGQDSKLGFFTGTPGTATITTAEAELNPGGRAFVSGFRPQVSGSSPSVTCRIGSRFRQGDAVTFTGALTPNSITGFADCLVESSYHRAETDIAGAFTQALGGEFLSQPAGAF